MSTPTMKHPDAEATASQINYLLSLARSHDVGFNVEDARAQITALVATGKFTRKMASEYIDRWKAMPKRAATNAGKKATPGYYAHDGKFIVVVENKAKTGTYAKVLKRDEDHWRWEYERGLAYEVADLTPITIEQAREFGRLHGRCLRCLRPLTDPASVEKSMGPVCSKYFTAA